MRAGDEAAYRRPVTAYMSAYSEAEYHLYCSQRSPDDHMANN